MRVMQKVRSFFVVALLIALLVSCGGPEQKRMKFFDKGKALYEQGDYVKARLELKNSLQIDPNFTEAYYLLGLVAMKENNPQQAYGSFLKTVELDPGHFKAQVQLGKLLLGAKAVDKAKEKVELVLGKEPENQEALLLKATILLAEKNVAEAKAILEGLQQKGVTEQNLFILLAAVYSQEKNIEQAAESLKAGIAANPKAIVLHAVLTDLYIRNQRVDEAVGVLQQIIALEPERIEHRLNLANVYWSSQQEEKAQALLQEITKSQPEKEEAWGKVAQFLVSKNKMQEAEQALRDGLQANSKSFDLRFFLKDLFLKTARVDEAVEILQECLTLAKDGADPKILQTHSGLAEIYLQIGELDKAREHVALVLKENPKSIEGHFIQGNIYLINGEGENAVSEFRVVVNERPDFIPAHIRLAEAHLRNNQPELAKDVLQQAMKDHGDSVELLRAFAGLNARSKDAEGTEAQLRKIVELHPDDYKARADLGDLYIALKKFAEAKEVFEGIRRDAPQVPAGYLKLSQLYYAQGDKEKSLGALREGYEKNPDSSALLEQLVKFHLAQKQFDQALNICQTRLQVQPADPFAFNMLGIVQTSKKDYAAAETAFMKAIELAPDWQPPQNSLANIYLLQGNEDKAIEKLQSSLSLNPRNPTAYVTLGAIYERKKQTDKAIEVYEQAITAIPNFWQAANNLAFLLSEYSTDKAGQEKALEYAKKALRLNPNAPAILDTVGWAYYKLGDLQKARGFLEQAIEQAPDAAEMNYHLAMALHDSGNLEAAREKLDKALAGDADFHGRKDAEKILEKMKQ